jgi:hypothetical protein
MTPSLLRQFWSLVETTQANVLLKLDDPSLVQWLLRQIRNEQPLDYAETDVLTAYIRSHLTLIRDIAHERLVVYR